MTPSERLFWERVQRRAARLAPRLRASVLRGFQELRAGLNTAQLARLVEATDVGRVIDIGFGQQEIDRAFLALRREVRDGVDAAGKVTASQLPVAARGIAFDVLNPRVIDAIRQLETRVVTTLAAGIRDTVRAYVENGLRDGVAPQTIARGLREIIGLAPNQLRAVDNFERLLRGGDRVMVYGEALERKLRDRRFDQTLERMRRENIPLSEAQIARMSDAYRARFVAFNAETNARTLALDAQKLGQRLTWESAVERGDVDGDRLFKRWAGVLDDRERPEHVAMEGETVRYEEPYSNGEQQPGETSFNCRCISIYFTVADPARAQRAGAGTAGLSREQLLAGMEMAG